VQLLSVVEPHLLRTTFIAIGLVLSSGGAMLWVGAFTLPQPSRGRVEVLASGMLALAPAALAWPLIETVGSVPFWATLAFFAGFLIATLCAGIFLLRYPKGPGQRADHDDDDQEEHQQDQRCAIQSSSEEHALTVGRAKPAATCFTLAVAFGTGTLLGRMLSRRGR
jgi:hypothetical protein